MTWYRRFTRLGLGLAALVWCLALLADWLHPVVVRHVICMEHGELLDAPEAVAHAHDTTVSEDPGGAHDPCNIDGSPPVAPRAWAPSLAWVPRAGPTAEGQAAGAHSSITTLSSAPKTSPPRG